ncbi:hypothetical protein CPER28S_02184 [Cellulomonas persica]
MWHVYAKHCFVTAHASSHSQPFSSTSTRMSSGTAITGWVSLSWKTIRSGSLCRSKSAGSTWSTKSLIEHATKKYCCCSRSSLPWGVESSGYRTLEMFSANVWARTASA